MNDQIGQYHQKNICRHVKDVFEKEGDEKDKDVQAEQEVQMQSKGWLWVPNTTDFPTPSYPLLMVPEVQYV